MYNFDNKITIITTNINATYMACADTFSVYHTTFVTSNCWKTYSKSVKYGFNSNNTNFINTLIHV